VLSSLSSAHEREESNSTRETHARATARVYSLASTFSCDHILLRALSCALVRETHARARARVHSIASTFCCKRILLRAHFLASTFSHKHIFLRAHSVASTFSCEHIVALMLRAHPLANIRSALQYLQRVAACCSVYIVALMPRAPSRMTLSLLPSLVCACERDT